jgi:hypothetical protein
MILDTGYICPEFSYLGFVPFAPETNVHALINSSGWNGPTQQISGLTGVSGVLGPGTFYPGSGSIDQITRSFWCVKSWQLNVNISRVMAADKMTCQLLIIDPTLPFPPFLDAFGFCSIGAFAGDSNTLPPAMNWTTKTLPTQDYCSYISAGLNYNKDRSGNCPYYLYSGFSLNTNVCSPLNPIQKFNDLLCRQSYFSWSPPEEDIAMFLTGDINLVKSSPYVTRGTQFRVLTPAEILLLGYVCPVNFYFQDVYSIFSLSIMDSDGVALSGGCLRNLSGYKPELYDNQYPFGCYGKSGEVLTNSWGEVTGYGINKKLSGISAPHLFDIGTGYVGITATGNDSRRFFPFLHFQMALRTPVLSVSNTNFCPINDIVSTVRTRVGQRQIGTLKIQDFISGFSTQALNNTTIMTVPLYAQTNTSQTQYLIEATLKPLDLWVSASGTPKY